MSGVAVQLRQRHRDAQRPTGRRTKADQAYTMRSAAISLLAHPSCDDEMRFHAGDLLDMVGDMLTTPRRLVPAAPGRVAAVMDDGVVTYDDVARWLPADIREHIETTVPCIGGGEHDWQHRSIDLHRMESAFTTTIESWSCTRPGCNLTVNVEPVRVAP